MARKPVHITSDAKRPEGRQVIWDTIRELGTFTVSEIEDRTRIKEATIKTYLRGLTNAGYLVRCDQERPANQTRYQPAVWKLIKDIGVDAPRVTKAGGDVGQGMGRENMWRTMRMHRSFTWRDLAVLASTEDHLVSEEEAKHYTRYLRRAGYLMELQKGGPGKLAVYRLLPSRYTGPRPPMIQRVRQVFDPNLGEVVWSQNQEGDES